MTESEIQKLLTQLLQLPKENEWFELKSANNNFDFNKLGQYNSALSNEANLRVQNFGWLILGIDNNKNIVGSSYKEKGGLQDLKNDIHQQSNLALREIYETQRDGKRILIFQISPAQKGQPTSWNGHYYGREGESLIPLSSEKYKRILEQTALNFDWSAQICEGATIDDLDINILELAKQAYANKIVDEESKTEVLKYNYMTFLNEARLIIGENKIPNGTLVLFGKEKSDYLLGQVMCEILWEEVDTDSYKKFRLPFYKAIGDVANEIKIREIEFPLYIAGEFTGSFGKVENYTRKNLREIIANSIAHQDYTQHCKISILESKTKVIFKNAGKSMYLEEEYLELLKPSNRQISIQKYRNKFLYDAMDKIGLIEGRGSGFRKWFKDTTQRTFLPTPEPNFNFLLAGHPKIDGFEYTIFGFSIENKFVEILQTKNKDLEVQTIILLDRVSKKLKITTQQFNYLKKLGLVDGKPTKCILSLEIAKAFDTEEIEDKKNQMFNFRHIFESSFLVHLNTKKDGMTKKEVVEFAKSHIKYTDEIDEKKLKSDISNSLTKMKKNNKIKSIGNSDISIKWYKI